MLYQNLIPQSCNSQTTVGAKRMVLPEVAVTPDVERTTVPKFKSTAGPKSTVQFYQRVRANEWNSHETFVPKSRALRY